MFVCLFVCFAISKNVIMFVIKFIELSISLVFSVKYFMLKNIYMYFVYPEIVFALKKLGTV